MLIGFARNEVPAIFAVPWPASAPRSGTATAICCSGVLITRNLDQNDRVESSGGV